MLVRIWEKRFFSTRLSSSSSASGSFPDVARKSVRVRVADPDVFNIQLNERNDWKMDGMDF